MPISGPSSFPSTIDEFVSHWMDVNTALGAGHELTLAEGTVRQDLLDRGLELETQRDTLTDLGVERQLRRATLLAQITALQARLVEFNGRVRGDFAGSIYVEALPVAFSVGDAENIVREALRKMSYIWGKLNGLSPAPPGVTLPLLLMGGLTITAFNTARETLRGAYTDSSQVEVDEDLARAGRDQLQDVIYPILKSYRQKITGLAAPHPDWVATLPRLTPEPGRTPAAVTAHVVWDAPTDQAKLTWTVSSEVDLEKYEIRGVPGDNYNTDDEVVLGSVPAGGPREFSTGFSLSASGLTAGFKVYVILHTGNEKGSPPVYVTRA